MSSSETFISHLIELRERLLRIVMGFVLVFLCLLGAPISLAMICSAVVYLIFKV